MENSSLKFVFFVVFGLILFQACTSSDDTYISLSEDELFIFKEGDILIYTNDENEFDSIYVHYRKLEYFIYDETQIDPQTYGQWQIVILSGEQSLKTDYSEDSLYCLIDIQTESKNYIFLEDTVFKLNSVLSDNIVNILGEEYVNVHTFEFDENLNDSLSARKYVFCPKYGIIQYELLDGTVYSFSHFIHSKESFVNGK